MVVADGDVPAIAVTGLAKRFGDTWALKECSLTACAGEVHAIVGENGSGKSTLAKVLGGVITPDRGRVSVFGKAPRGPRSATGLGVALVMQEVLVVDGASVLDNLFIGQDGLVRPRISTKTKSSLAAELMDKLVGEPVDLRARVDGFPLSVRQWVVIARALLLRPRALILDESSAPLDAPGVGRLQQVVAELAAAGTCVLVVTHRIEELPGFADRASILRDGVSVGVLQKDELTEDRLLALMSGSATASTTEQGAGPPQVGPPRLKARTLGLRPSAVPFDLEVAAHEILGVAALEGHGGPQALEALAGLRRPVSGAIEFCGTQATVSVRSLKEAVDRGVTYVSGDRTREGLLPNMNVLDNFGMALYRKLRRGPFTDLEAVKHHYVEQSAALGLKAASAKAPIGSLSGGNQQKLLIGRALAQSPEVLILNDPTRGVDIPTKRELYALLKRLASSGVAVVLFSTEVEELVAVAHRVAVLRDHSLYTVLRRDELTSAALLGALFGQGRSTHDHARAATQ